jgi:PEGA domain
MIRALLKRPAKQTTSGNPVAPCLRLIGEQPPPVFAMTLVTTQNQTRMETKLRRMETNLRNSICRTVLPGMIGLILFCGSGCVHRRILVRSDPEGALVTIDQQPIGHTPVAVPFTYYGTREIRVEKDGFATQKCLHTFPAPWYQIPPLDFITDNFWPREINDDRVVDVQLIPATLADENQLLDRAGQLRGNVHRGTVPMPLAREEPPSTETPPASTAALPSVLDRFR